MTPFWIACGVLLLVAAAFVAVPLLRAARTAERGPARDALNAAVYRDHIIELDRELADGVLSAEQHALARVELDRRALSETQAAVAANDVQSSVSTAAGDAAVMRARGRWLAPGALVVIPLLAIGLYLKLGNPAALQPPEQQFTQMVDELAARLAREPGDVQGWVMLGRAYQLLGRMPDAVSAFEKASALKPDSAELLASQADALAMVQGSLTGRPLELIRKALDLDPKNQTAIALAATAAMEGRQFDEALQLWQRLASLVEANSRDRTAIDDAIAQTRQAAAAAGVTLSADTGGTRAPSKDTAVQGAPAAAMAASSISGEVTLAPELLAQATPEETVFVFARAIDGPPLPLAVVRAKVKDLPLKFTLDDSMSMAPGAKLSLHKTVNVSARISRSGQAMPQAGDLVGNVQQVTVGTAGLKVRIADVVR